MLKLTVAYGREADGRWIGSVEEIPGALAYGETPEQAIGTAVGLALAVISDELRHGERAPSEVQLDQVQLTLRQLAA